jgi:hypothetical protein
MFAAIRSLLRAAGEALTGSTKSRVSGHTPTFAKSRKPRVSGHSSGIVMAWPIGTTPGDPPVPRSLPLPLLTHLAQLDAADWLKESMTTFARSVASFLPGHFPAYARIYHPFTVSDSAGITSRWRDLPGLEGLDIEDSFIGGHVAMMGVRNAQAQSGTPTRQIVETLIEHLRPATNTPDECYFAVWVGFGGAVPEDLMPQLELPEREYHVFTGPIAAAQTSYDAYSFGQHNQFANLWWPADHSWCVSTEVDSVWTHVGGSRACIDAILSDPRLETSETSAQARW